MPFSHNAFVYRKELFVFYFFIKCTRTRSVIIIRTVIWNIRRLNYESKGNAAAMHKMKLLFIVDVGGRERKIDKRTSVPFWQIGNFVYFERPTRRKLLNLIIWTLSFCLQLRNLFEDLFLGCCTIYRLQYEARIVMRI